MSDCSTHAGDVVREARVKGTEPGAWGEKASGEATTASILFDFVFVWRRRPCEVSSARLFLARSTAQAPPPSEACTRAPGGPPVAARRSRLGKQLAKAAAAPIPQTPRVAYDMRRFPNYTSFKIA